MNFMNPIRRATALVLVALVGLVAPQSTVLADAQSAEPAGYGAMSYFRKMDILWDHVSSRPYTRKPNRLPGIFTLLASLRARYLAEAFNRESDFRRRNYRRVIHPFGTLTPVDFEVTRQVGQTGLLSSGGQGLIRFSLAVPDQSFLPFAPGLALKFPVSGKASIDFQAMYSLDGRSNRNFFELPFRTFIPRPTNSATISLFNLFKKALRQVENGPNSPVQLSIRESETLHQNGTPVADVDAPKNYAVSFAASARLRSLLESTNWAGDFRNILAHRVPAGTELMDVYLYRTRGAQPVKIGVLRTRANFVSSKNGDEGILFRHQKTAARR